MLSGFIAIGQPHLIKLCRSSGALDLDLGQAKYKAVILAAIAFRVPCFVHWTVMAYL